MVRTRTSRILAHKDIHNQGGNEGVTSTSWRLDLLRPGASRTDCLEASSQQKSKSSARSRRVRCVHAPHCAERNPRTIALGIRTAHSKKSFPSVGVRSQPLPSHGEVEDFALRKNAHHPRSTSKAVRV